MWWSNPNVGEYVPTDYERIWNRAPYFIFSVVKALVGATDKVGNPVTPSSRTTNHLTRDRCDRTFHNGGISHLPQVFNGPEGCSTQTL